MDDSSGENSDDRLRMQRTQGVSGDLRRPEVQGLRLRESTLVFVNNTKIAHDDQRFRSQPIRFLQHLGRLCQSAALILDGAQYDIRINEFLFPPRRNQL